MRQHHYLTWASFEHDLGYYETFTCFNRSAIPKISVNYYNEQRFGNVGEKTMFERNNDGDIWYIYDYEKDVVLND